MPAFVHALLKSLEVFGSVLGLVAFKGAFEVLEILRRVGNGHGQIRGIDGVEREGGRPDGIERLGLRRSQAGIVEFDAGISRLHNLSNGIRDEAMIGMAVAAVWAPSDEDLRMKTVNEIPRVVDDGVDILREGIGDGAKFAVVEVEKDRGLDTELLASAGGFSARRAAASSSPAGILAKSVAPFSPLVAIAR